MKPLLLLLVCVSARAATMPDLDLLRAIAGDQAAQVQELSKPEAAPATRDYEGLVTVQKKSPDWRRPADALKDRSVVLEDRRDLTPRGKAWAWVKDNQLGRALTVGAKAWVKGTFGDPAKDKFRLESRVLEVKDLTVFPLAPIPAKIESKDLALELVEVSPWCDHMPMASRRQHLVVSFKLSNKSAAPLTVSLKKAFLSLDGKTPGAPVEGLSIRGANGLPSGETSTVLDAGASEKLQLRGDGLYPEGLHDKTLYLTLQLSAGNRTFFVKGSGAVIATQ